MDRPPEASLALGQAQREVRAYTMHAKLPRAPYTYFALMQMAVQVIGESDPDVGRECDPQQAEELAYNLPSSA